MYGKSSLFKLGTKSLLPISKGDVCRASCIHAKVAHVRHKTNSSLFELYVIQNDAIARMTGHWLHAVSVSLGTEFFQSQSHLILSLLNILSGSLSLDTPLPPFMSTPQGVSFRVLVQERMPEELSLEHVEENGYAVFAALAVSSRLVSREIERCVGLVRSLVGEMDLRWDVEELKKYL